MNRQLCSLLYCFGGFPFEGGGWNRAGLSVPRQHWGELGQHIWSNRQSSLLNVPYGTISGKIQMCCDGAAFVLSCNIKTLCTNFIPQRSLVRSIYCWSHLKTVGVYSLVKPDALLEICALWLPSYLHTFTDYSLSLPSQPLLQPWTSASFPKRKVRAPNLSSSGTTMPPARAACVSGTEAAVETRIASRLLSSVWRPVENQVHVMFIILISWYQWSLIGNAWGLLNIEKRVHESGSMNYAAAWLFFSVKGI